MAIVFSFGVYADYDYKWYVEYTLGDPTEDFDQIYVVVYFFVHSDVLIVVLEAVDWDETTQDDDSKVVLLENFEAEVDE